MILKKQWRILTVGDGDLSFSQALHTHLSPDSLTASIYDSEAELRDKYQTHALDTLKKNAIEVLTQFDVTDTACWQQLPSHHFDVVIFQFPLVPGFANKRAFDNQALSINTLNRRLLRCFIQYATQYALDPEGEMLCYVTSKDVKPYCEWDLESALNLDLDIHYLGQSPFDINQFDGYKIRNVDRDKHVKDTSGITYAWSKKVKHPLEEKLSKPYYLAENHCAMCRVGPFMTEKDRDAHTASKKHQTMLRHHTNWLNYLKTSNENITN